MLKIVQADKGKNLHRVRALFVEYAGSLDFDLCFQDFDEELANLPGDYAPPRGCLLLAMQVDQVAGCAALREISEGICEMKRMYVRPEFRRSGIGRALAQAVIAAARTIGYDAMRLDTVSSMKAATSLYRSLGFKETSPYRHNPLQGALFLELKLDPAP
jgi:ribosomal protein S18 acetylase RimI-like enzyme